MSESDPEATGRVLHYRLERKLGEDALGEVHLALDETLERQVVVKLVRTVDAAAPWEVTGWRAYFRSEARRAARVSHAGLVTIHAYEEVGDADLIVMEYADGETVEAMLAAGARWWPAGTVRLMIRVAEAVEAAHAQGVAHGHLSLRNVKISPEGRVKVLDLGIPKLSQGAELPLAEAAGQGPAGKPRADVQQLGRMLARLLTVGRRQGDDPGAPDADAESPDHAMDARIMAAIDPVLALAAADRSGERYATAGELAEALGAVLDAAMESAATPYRRGAYGYTRADLSPGMRGGSAIPAHDRIEIEPIEEPADPAALVPYSPFRPNPVPASPSRLVLPPGFDPSTVPDEMPLAPTAPPTMLRHLARQAERLDLRGSRRVATAGIVMLLAAGGAAAWMIAGGGGDEPEPPAVVVDASQPPVRPVPTPEDREPTESDADVAPSGAVAGTITGRVTSPVAGAVATAVDGDGEPLPLPADLTVPVGDSLVLEVRRAGYVPTTRVFRGGLLDVPLIPDSVVVTFRSNVEAAVLLAAASGPPNPRRIGTTNSTLRLPTGRYRVIFRTQLHPEWTTPVTWTSPGARYAVEKMDYGTHGTLLVTVEGTWARVSLDGGAAHETPYRFEEVPIGTHVLRLMREGYETITDTVTVRANAVQTQRYALRRSP